MAKKPPPAYAPNEIFTASQPLLAVQDETPMADLELFQDCLTARSSASYNSGTTTCRLKISDGSSLHSKHTLDLTGKMEKTTWSNIVRYGSLGIANRKVSLDLKTHSGTKLIKIQRKMTGSNKLLVKSPHNNGAHLGHIRPTFGIQQTFFLEDANETPVAKFCVSGIKFACFNQKIKITDINLNTDFGEVDLGDGTISFHAGCPKNANLRILIICAYLLVQAL